MTRNPDLSVVQPTLLNELLETHQLIDLISVKNAPHSLMDQAATILARRLEYTDNAEVEALNRFHHNKKQHAEEIADLKKQIASQQAQLAELQNTARQMDRTIQDAHNFLDRINFPRTAAVSTPIGDFPLPLTLAERFVELYHQLLPYKRRFDFLSACKKSPRWRCEVDSRGVLLFDVPAESGSGPTHATIEKAIDSAILNSTLSMMRLTDQAPNADYFNKPRD